MVDVPETDVSVADKQLELGGLESPDNIQPFDGAEPFIPSPDDELGDKSADKSEPKADTDKSQQAQWDKDRQARDQENANLRKELIASNEAVRNELAETKAKLADRDKQPGPADELAKTDLSEDTEYAALTAHVKKQSALLAQQQDKIARLDSALSAVSQGQQADADATAEREMIAGLSKKYGAEFQNEAVQLAANRLVRAGYNNDNTPDRFATYTALELSYRDVKDKADKGKTETKPNTTIPLDTGKGGRTPSTTAKDYKSVDEAADAIFK